MDKKQANSYLPLISATIMTITKSNTACSTDTRHWVFLGDNEK